jgi:hypothetical protein
MKTLDANIEAVVTAFAEACARKEGFYVTEQEAKERQTRYPTIATRNNNPLNLRKWGAYPIRDGFANFVKVTRGKQVPDLEAGWRAAKFQVRKNIVERRLSFFTFFAGERNSAGAVVGYPGFAPESDGNNPTEYALFVLTALKEKGLIAQTADIHSQILSVVLIR